MSARITNQKDLAGGALMLVLGLATALVATNYRIGSLSRMGPGFFPLALGVILAVSGMAIIVTSRSADVVPAVRRLAPEWRGWFCICAGIAAFVFVGRYGGLLPATFAIVFISALGDRTTSPLAAAVLALSMSFVCFVVFWWLLQVQFPLFRWG
jgi:hypothetical protein